LSRGDEFEPAAPRQLSGLEGFFANTNVVLLCLLAFCCNVFAIFTILGIVGLVTFKDPTAKQNAMIVTIVSGIGVVLGILSTVAQLAMKH
jgi:multisubunit Na+/H+ antiporter MnhG subunit